MFSTKLFSQTVTHEEWVSQDGYGVPTYGTSHVCKAREESDFVYLRENFRELQTTDTVIYIICNDIVPKIRDRITLIDGSTFPIKHILHNRNDVGTVKFYTIVCGM